MAKASSNKKGTTKKELLDSIIADAVSSKTYLQLDSVDFSDPNRPKTCLEIDFPILPINSLAAVESASGAARKPIYLATKWWARRQPSVFRSMLIAAATRSPLDPSEAAKIVWDSYYGNHQKNEAFKKLTVADIFMGGGTTIVEGSRLGMQMLGNDLNPVAWFVVKNELAKVQAADVRRLLDEIEAEVKPQIMPFYACNCPRGHKGKWTQRSTGREMGESFDPLALNQQERADYDYTGPEIIYTFWAKHGPCQATGCNHRTPILSSPIIAVKTLMVKAWKDIPCSACKQSFDIEEQDARMAPSACLVVSTNESPFTVQNADGSYTCPHCRHTSHRSLGKSVSKSVECALALHSDWLAGTNALCSGGTAKDGVHDTIAWLSDRELSLQLLELRGSFPDTVRCPETGKEFYPDKRSGNVPRQATFVCREDRCGTQNEVLAAIRATGTTAPIAPYAIQGFCPECKSEGRAYGGRFFDKPRTSTFTTALIEWTRRSEGDLAPFWPRSELPFGFMTHMNNGGIPNHGYSHWWMMFNARQLLVHTQILKVVANNIDSEAAETILGIMPQVLRANCNFSFWNEKQDCLEPMLGASNFHPKMTTVENCVFNNIVGRGTLRAYSETLLEAIEYKDHPWDLVSTHSLADLKGVEGLGKTYKLVNNDSPTGVAIISCGSSSRLETIHDQTVDLVITDPPFGGLMHYSELSDFFYVWLRLLLRKNYPNLFEPEYTPKALEAVSNKARHPEDPDGFYQKVLTECWRESYRILKPGGILAFTFHHSEDEPWIAVLESLFNAGYYLEATYPIRSDDTKGEGAKPGTFGSQLIEYDILHVCRKRVEDSREISWARLRRQILADVRQLQDILEQHQQAGLQEADLQVIRRGKALEYYSKHYGKVYVEKGREFTVKEALTGINQLLDDQTDSSAEVPPVDAEPYTRQFLRLFADATSLPRDQIQKYLRGTGVSPAEFEERGWCTEKSKVFHVTPPLELARKWKGVSRQGMGRDFDQAMFLIGACYENSGIRVQDTLNSDKFAPHPATGDVIDWFTRHGGDADMKAAARLAKQLYTKWVTANEPKLKAAQQTFDFSREDA